MQGGNEEEGAAELEEKLANADPGRAATDEADPADAAQGEAEATETTAATPPTETLPPPASLAEPASLPPANEATEASPEPAPEATVPEMEETLEKAALAAPSAAMPSPAPVTEPTPEPEEPAAADGFSGDEPALGGGATEDMGAADLSPAEQQAALSTIGESAGGGGDGGGGGGGGSAMPDSPPPETPKVAEAEPTAALAQIGHLPPAQLQQSLGEVGKAVTKSTQDKRTELAANPPQIERPTGSPKNLQGDQTAIPIVDGKPQGKVEKAPEGEAIPIASPAPLPELPPSPAERIPEPVVSGGEGGELSQKDVTQLSNSMESLPVHDAGLNVPKQPPPQVALAGNADPTKTDEQRQKLQASVAETATQGRHDVAQEMGENTKIYPSVPPEKITAKVPAGEAAAGATAAPMAEGSIEPEALSAIAQQEKGGEIQAAVGQAQQTMSAKKDEYNTQVADEKAKSNKEIADLESKSAADQSQVRAEAQASVTEKKQQWNTEQTKAVQTANQQADDEVAKGRKEVQSKKQEADRQAAEQINQGNQEAEAEREKAEKTAAEEKAKGEKESKGFFGWLASKAKAFFNKIKAAIKSAFDYARKKIKQAIEAAKKAAMAAIDLARNAIVAAIKAVGNALIAIGDKLLAGFPGLRDKFRKAIQNTVDAAVKKVNEYADQLKKGVAAALDALAAGLDKLAGWLEKGLLAAVDGLAAVVDGAIKFADKIAQAVGAFAALIKDVAAGPIAWLKNLGAGVVDGIKNHLWKAFKEAVKEWFNSKLEQVLGLGSMVWNLIKGGGLALAEVGKMAWEGIKALIPPTLIRILVEKLVAMIVPAAGALMVIIEGLQAAWGTVQRIIAAFQKFFAFLKAVKAGNAGPAFAVALAAAAIAVIDFVANWLILKLAKGAAKIGGKIKGLAKKILGRKKGKAAGKKAKAKAKDKTKTKTVAKKPTTPKQPTKKPATQKPTKGKDKKADKKADKKRDQDRKKQERVEKIKRELPPKIHQLLARKPSKVRVLTQLAIWRFSYKLKKLELKGKGSKFDVVGQVNPSIDLADGWTFEASEVFKILDKIAEEYISEATAAQTENLGKGDPEEPISLDLSHPASPTTALAEGKAFQIGKTEAAQSNLGQPVGYKHQPSHVEWQAQQGWMAITGSASERGHRYASLRKKLAGVEVGTLFTKLLRKEPIPNLPPEQKAALEELFGLWFAKEPSHPRRTYGHRRDLAYTLMVSEIMTPKPGEEHLKKHFNVAQGIGLHPAAYGGAQEGARRVTAEMLNPDTSVAQGKKTNRNRDIRYKREIATIKEWFKRHAKDLPVLDRPPNLVDVENFVREKLRQYHRPRQG
ncbi:hypothetical protein ACQ4M4_21870 [Leptolyngbya sp. AN02str]|uniref:phage tail protein n=1 Tax=Leptolyngbya sp. AN02str TaxID=3423363 RepID=UPI003D31F3E5